MSKQREVRDLAAELRRKADEYAAGTLERAAYRAARRQLLAEFAADVAAEARTRCSRKRLLLLAAAVVLLLTALAMFA